MTKEKKVFHHQPDHWVNKPSVNAITDQRLDYFDRCLLMYMCYRFDYFNDVLKKPYFESTQTLADVFNVHRNTVSKAIQTLKTSGYINIQVKKGSSNTYTKVTTWLNGVTPAGEDKPKHVQHKSETKQAVKPNPIPVQQKSHWSEPEDEYGDIPF
jgi:biotin operon repressor